MTTTTRPRPTPRRPASPRARRRRLRRLAPLSAIALASFLGGAISGGGHLPPERRVADRFADAWEHGDYAAMHALLTDGARAAMPLDRFAEAYRAAARTATVRAMHAGRPRAAADGAIAVPFTVHTRVFGELDATVALPIADKADGEKAIAWAPELVFPGLARGEELTRETRLPERATIEARDGTSLAEGDARLSDLGALAAEVAGRVGPAPEERARELEAEGLPAGAPVGLSGLERQFDARLAGTPGGTLRAGTRILAATSPRRGADVRTTIDPGIQRAAAAALAGRYGGIAVVRPRDGEILAMTGLASSAPQPPGSVFKIVTLAAAVQAGTVDRGATFPLQTEATLEGVKLENAHGESCGGSLIDAFAHSCNSVFAPLGAELGARRLVAAAERFGFNEPAPLEGAARSTVPAAAEIGDALAVGSTAIGQGKLLATPLHMAMVAAAIGEDGRRVRPTLLRGARTSETRATTPSVAAFVARAMRAVVTSGTGVGAALPGVEVAGKTGTAELRSTVSQDPLPPADPGDPAQPVEEDTTDTDAWFAAFAPYRHPKVAICVLLVAQGAGGETAAPVARQVLEAAL